MFGKIEKILVLIFISLSFNLFANSKLGSGKKLDGKIVVISIFADDKNTTWGNARINPYAIDVMNYMKIATDWICENVKKYNAKPEFIYNFFENGGIYYKTKFNVDMTDWHVTDDAVFAFIEKKIDLNFIKKFYQTDNIFFMVYLNTPKSNKISTATRSYYEGMPFEHEIIYIYRYTKKTELSPSSYAHEILHIFGAKDLYYADTRNGFSQSFVDYCKKNLKNDIMLTISDVKNGGVHYDKITNEVGQFDAYYLGFEEFSAERDMFNLPKSEHEK